MCKCVTLQMHLCICEYAYTRVALCLYVSTYRYGFEST